MTDEVTDKIVVALVGNLGDPNQGDPQFSIHTSVDRDSGELDGVLDRVHLAFARQKAKAEIVRVEKHIRMCEKMIASAKEDDDVREEMYLAECARVRDEIAKLQDKVPALVQADMDAWGSKERAGAYKQSNSTASAINGLKGEASKRNIDLANLSLNRDVALKNLGQRIQSWVNEITDDNAELGRLKALVG